MSPEQIRKAVEDFLNLLGKQEKLQNRLIKLSGRDSDQEIIILQQLHTLERTIEFIDYALYEADVLTVKEECAVIRRAEGLTLKELAAYLSYTRQGAENILNRAYRKMADAANKQNIS